MQIPQLSLFLENKPGQILEPCALLAKAGINILTLTLADTQQFGILRLIVNDWQKAKKVLEETNHVVNVTEVVAIEVPDHPGGLKEVLDKIVEAGLNIEYTYAFTFGRKDKAILIFRFEDVDRAIEVLQSNNLDIVDKVGLYGQKK